MIKPTKAIIFSAGLGTRFKPWTDKHPKALAVINGKTLLQHNIEYLQKYGVNEVVVNVHHFADQIIEAIKANNGWGSTVTISDEKQEVLETGGGLVKAAPFLQDQPAFISLNVDVLTDLDINKVTEAYHANNSLIAFAVSGRDTSRKILFDENMRMCGWKNFTTGEEKIVRSTNTADAFAYSCVSVYSGKVFDHLQQTGKFSIMDGFLQLAKTHVITGVPHDGDKWIDVGKPEAVAKAEAMFS